MSSPFSSSDSETDAGVGAVIAFTFFPIEQLAIELANQGHVYIYESDRTNTYNYYDNTDYDGAGFGNLSLSLQYRF